MVKFKPLNVKPIKDKGTYVFGDFSIGLYYLDTPRLLGEQLASLALVGGQNIWAEKGALVPQYGYKLLDKLPEGERPVIVTNDSSSSASFFIVTVDGNGDSHVYLYTANQGLKKYKTQLGNMADAVAAHDGKNLIINFEGATYLFGSYYSNSADFTLTSDDVTFYDYSSYYEFIVPEDDADYYWNGKEIVVQTDVIDPDTQAHTTTNYHFTIISLTPSPLTQSYTIRAVIDKTHEIDAGGHVTLDGNTVDIGESTILEADLIYYPEEYTVATPVYIVSGSTPYTAGWFSLDEGGAALTPEEGIHYVVVDDESEYEGTVFDWDGSSYIENSGIQTTTIHPSLIEVAQNRLFVVDEVGRIYYSCVGGVDVLAGGEKAFEQASDAGYFEGFYKDSSKVLSIEDYMDGILICKENGIYYLTLQMPTYQISSTGSGNEGILSVSQMQVGIKKIANIGQQYAGDHVIVKESVIAYDSNCGTIVNAASVNVFNAIVAGDVIIDAATLNAYNSGITATKRKLTYNGQENLFTLYYGEDLTNGVVLKLNATLFPRKLDIPMEHFIGFNQGVTGVGTNGEIIQDFKNGTIIENIPAYADFEAIGVRDNRQIVSTILEVTELNGTDFTITTKNTGTSVQTIRPNLNIGVRDMNLPPLMYSDKSYDIISDSFELTSRWADKKANVTRVAAPMSGRDGVSISIEFPKNTSFCLAALRLPDFSLGEI